MVIMWRRTLKVIVTSLWIISYVSSFTEALRFEFCLVFRGRCEDSCGTDTIQLLIKDFCSNDKKCCIPVPPTTTTTTTTITPRTTSTTPTTTTRSTTTSTTTTTPPPTTTPFIPECGIMGTSILSRIIGGGQASKCELPWMVYVARTPGDNNPCGGSIVDSRHVITAAHCFDYLSSYKPQVTIGEYRRSEVAPQDKFTTTDYEIFTHPRYDKGYYFNDIAVIRLSQPVNYLNYTCIRPLCLPKPGQNFPNGTQCIVAGWGVTKAVYDVVKPPMPETLMKVTLPIVDEAKCQRKFGRYYNSTIETCAGQLDGNKDSCDGDSGGPLMCQGPTGTEYFAAGIVSSGAGCARVDTPAIYTDVASFSDWIQQIIGEAS